MAAMSDAQPSKLNLWMDFLATNKVDETSAPLCALGSGRKVCVKFLGFYTLPLRAVGSRCVEYIWIRQPTELKQKKAAGADSGDLHQFKYTPLVSCSRSNHRHYDYSNFLVCI